MKKRVVLFLLLLPTLFAGAQQFVDLRENASYSYNGLEYGYYVTNESSKAVKGEDFDRYEITLYVTNKSGCMRLIPFRPTSDVMDEDITLAEFGCKNATGKRLTAKGGKLNAKPWMAQVKMPVENQPNKYRYVNVQVGYAIRNGQTISNKIIVIVPKGETPQVSCRTFDLPDM
jgi:hypothetical protein